jgi:peptide methionine sulfoxide reductase MsrA
VGKAALEGQPGVKEVSNGWRGFKEINEVLYDPDRINIEEMVRILKKTGTYRGTAYKP